MKLGVDLGHITEGATGGLVPYLQGVLEALFVGWPQHEIVIFGSPSNEPLFPNLPPHVRRLTLDAEGYYPLLGVCAAALDIDVLFSAYPSDAEMAFPPARRVVMIPDCQQEFFPEFFDPETLRSRRATFGSVLRGAGAIATLSEHARCTLLSQPDARCRDVFVSSPALRTESHRPTLDSLTDEERGLLPRGDYFIYPANLWPHKNHRRVLEAFERFLRGATRPTEFVFTGHPQGWEDLRRSFPGLPIRHLGFVRRGFLQVLLARARALIFFSLFEGFGMPLLEAFASGTPVACSNTTSLPEVGGDAVATCDPTDPAAMSALMALVSTDEDARARLVERGRERLTRYDWTASAAQLVEAFERVRDRTGGVRSAAPDTVRAVVQFVRTVQADRAARLGVIQNLEAHLRSSEAAQAEQNRRLVNALQEVEADRKHLLARIDHLQAALNRPWPLRWLRSCARLLKRRLPGTSLTGGAGAPRR
ncbi:glycosyltransferase family 4 protein [Frigoriglobus tundricola]|uniref:GT4 family glycosyltransferase n=1 Tax=Frigoriglobus tundricola TaxID=2774151 RepID=A0A6M5Z163_9BACT|nr:glycosyltransferase family 1 protein [Frigoriglobus tundricola]QJW99908.1 GT4 family glycosyltransferase [Frigoriglobus tundricola]